MINIINFPALRNVEFIGFGNDIIKIIDAANPTTLNLAAAYDPFKAKWNELADYFALQRGSLLSDDLRRLDERRDHALVGIRTVAEGYKKHFDPARVNAAERIMATMDKYGKSIHRQNVLAETETVRNLVTDFETDLEVKNSITLLALTDWVAELKDGNTAFNTLYLKRNEEALTKPDASLAEMRKPAMEAYRALAARLNALEILVPSPELTKVIGMINELVGKYNQTTSSRSKKADTADSSNTPA